MHVAAGNGSVQGPCCMKARFSHPGKKATVDINVVGRDFVEMDIDEYRYKIQILMHRRL